MAGDDKRRAFDLSEPVLQRLCDLQRAPAILSVEQRQVLTRKQISYVHNANRGKEHPRIAVGVAAAEVEQVHFILAASERELVAKGASRERVSVGSHLLHPLPDVSLRD